MLENYLEIFELENTSIIYDGIKRLWEQLLLDKSRNCDDIAMQILKMHEECRMGGEYLAQNLMSEFFQFLNFSSQQKMLDVEAKALGGMVLFYDKVLQMEHNHDQMGIHKTYSEDYSEICIYLSMIAKEMDCYLVHVRDSGNLILASYTAGTDKSTEDFIYRIDKEDNGEAIRYGNTVAFLPSRTKNEKQRILIKLLLSRRKDVEYKQTVYIVFAGGNEINREQCMQIVRNILFLRQQLQLLLERDLYALRHFRISYEDVKPICKNEKCNILHISDLHVDSSNCELIKKLISETEFGYEIGGNENTPPIDLIVITGDVAQGQSTATDMEVNYKKAEEVIRSLAQRLWGNTSKGFQNIRFDWKKRIIIIPGNHDYASMNELLVVHRNRATFNGEPAREEGSPMIKYTYYIDFVRRLLDLDISTIVKQNLNDYRAYPNYNLEFVCFNTISEVSMLRNNKVQIDEEFLKSLPNKEKEKYARIFLMHHTPLYVEKNMDYNKDKYGYRDIDDTLYGILEAIETKYWRKEFSAREEIDIRKQLDNISSMGKRTAIYQDVKYLYLHRKELTNERCNQIISEYRKNKKMRDKDRAIYEKRLEKYMNCIMPDIILGGHTHVKREGEYRRKNRQKNRIKCCEVAKFLARDTADYLNYGILTIDEKHNMEYKFYTTKFNSRGNNNG